MVITQETGFVFFYLAFLRRKTRTGRVVEGSLVHPVAFSARYIYLPAVRLVTLLQKSFASQR